VVAEKIRDLLAATPDKIFASKNEKAAVEKFYQRRNLAPLWLDKGIENARAKAVIVRLKEAEADGLDASDYHTPDFAGLAADALAEADLKLTQAVLTFARHLQAGRFPYARLSHNIHLPQTPPEPAAILARMVDAGDADKALDEFAPPHAAYQKLKAKLAEMRAKSSGPRVEIADGPLVKLNPKAPVQDARVPLLREKLGLSGEASDLAYDAALAAAVRKFQQANELPATGSLDARTVKALNAPVKDRQIDLVIANMERWRWYPRDLGADHVIVNQPDFMLKVIHNGSQVWTTKVVIGNPAASKQTPLLSETMKSITINPTWNVPPSIVYGEYLPALARDPTVLARMGLNVTYGRDGSVVNISQPPGGTNVLGRVRFNFPNRFLVYQHDTNEKFMFAHEVRVDDAGKLQTRRDVYNIDGRLIAAVKNERAIIEPAPDGKPAEVASTGGRRRAAAPPAMSFFQSLFFGGRPPPRPSHGIYR
jgi:murein L,D-transpeptidase YcbB/YkuD